MGRQSTDYLFEHWRWIIAGVAVFLESIPELTYFLIILMAIDTVFGTAATIKQRKLSSTAMWMAATRKLGSLAFVAMAAVVDRYVNLLGIDLVQVTTVFYIGPEFVSILRNAAILEVPVPPQFTNILRYFQEQERENPTPPKKPN